jgi:hypothetical protein
VANAAICEPIQGPSSAKASATTTSRGR